MRAHSTCGKPTAFTKHICSKQERHSREHQGVEHRDRQLHVPKVARAVLVAQPTGCAAVAHQPWSSSHGSARLHDHSLRHSTHAQANVESQAFACRVQHANRRAKAAHLSCVSIGPMAASYRPFGTAFLRLSYTSGLVIRLTLSLRICTFNASPSALSTIKQANS